MPSNSETSSNEERRFSSALRWGACILLIVSIGAAAGIWAVNQAMDSVETVVRRFPRVVTAVSDSLWVHVPAGSIVEWNQHRVGNITSIQKVRVSLPQHDSLMIYAAVSDSKQVELAPDSDLVGIVRKQSPTGPIVITLVREPAARLSEFGILRLTDAQHTTDFKVGDLKER